MQTRLLDFGSHKLPIELIRWNKLNVKIDSVKNVMFLAMNTILYFTVLNYKGILETALTILMEYGHTTIYLDTFMNFLRQNT